jgi:hypothetical protein
MVSIIAGSAGPSCSVWTVQSFSLITEVGAPHGGLESSMLRANVYVVVEWDVLVLLDRT